MEGATYPILIPTSKIATTYTQEWNTTKVFLKTKNVSFIRKQKCVKNHKYELYVMCIKLHFSIGECDFHA